MTQALLLNLYRRATRLVFNLVLVTLLLGLFVGVGRSFLELGLTFTEPTVRLGLKDLVTNTLSLIIVLELVRVFVDYFEFERVRLEVLLEIGVALALRELLLLLFAEELSGLDLFLRTLGILALVAGRTLAVQFSPQEVALKAEEVALPGVGRKFTIAVGSRDRLVIVVHHSEKRELQYFGAGEEDEPAAALDLTDEEAREVGAILAGILFHPEAVGDTQSKLGQPAMVQALFPERRQRRRSAPAKPS